MHVTILHSGWNAFLVAVPFVTMLSVGYFRLDERLAAFENRPDQKDSPESFPECEATILPSLGSGQWSPRLNQK
jgi:hypothetical protein